MDIKNIKNELNSFGAEVVKNARQNLVAAGKGGGRLEASIDFDVKMIKNVKKITLSLIRFFIIF